jgi:PAS domain S-box-containing protein
MNVNEHAQLDERVRESADLSAGIIGSAMDAIIAVDDAQRIVLFNSAAERIFACPANEAIGSSVERFIPERFRDGHNTRVRRFGESGVTNRTLNGLGTLWGLRATGEEFPIEASISKVESAGKKFFTAVIRDITERKQTEEALRESEEQFRTLAEAIPQLCWMARGDGYVFWYNQRWYTYTGTTPEQMKGWGWQSVHDPRTLPSVLERWKAAISTGEPSGMVFPLRGADGVFRPFLTRVMPIKDAEGRIVRWFGTDTDITELRDAQEALRASEERLRLAAQAGKMYAFEWDVITDVLVRSSEYVNVLGATEPRTLTHQQAMEKIHPDDRPTLVAALARHSPEKPTVDVTYRVLLPGKSPVWVKSSGRAFFDAEGRMLRVVGMVADVTDQKLAEEKLREYEKAVEGLEEMIVVIDREYRYLVANRKFLNMRHQTREQVVGHFAHEVVSKEAYEAIVKEKLDECFRGKVVRYEMRYRYPEIGERDLLVSYFPIEGVSGIDRAACIFQDITERKRAEEALSSMSRKLIEAQEHERARIARELHDDINQRLAMLAVELEQLKENPSEVGSRVQELRRQTTEMSNDVQALSHDLHSSQLEYLGAVAGMKGWCKEFGDRQGMQIDCRHDVRSTLPTEIGLCLFRVLQEALHNAAKHSGEKRIEVQLREEPGEIHLIVSDSGRGFDVEAVKQGKGLGLTSMRERVRLVDGTFVIDSKPMGGTTIHVRVPLDSEHASQRVAV